MELHDNGQSREQLRRDDNRSNDDAVATTPPTTRRSPTREPPPAPKKKRMSMPRTSKIGVTNAVSDHEGRTDLKPRRLFD